MIKKVLFITQDPLVNFRQTINGEGFSDNGRYRFYINNIDDTPDFVVVMGKGKTCNRSFDVPKERTMLITTEPYGIIEYPRRYCEQFGTVLACHPEIKVSFKSSTRVVYVPTVLPWFVGATFLKDGIEFTMNREDIAASQPEKSKFISVITSKKAFTKGHVDRSRFVRKLKEYYGDRVDVYGSGYKEFNDKWEALSPYKYHIVIENSNCDYYWTEKLADCFLAGSYPFYYGCTNIEQFFLKGSYTPIDICNFESVVRLIEDAEKHRVYENSCALLQDAKDKVLSKYNNFNIIAQVLDNLNIDCNKKGETFIKPLSAFFSFHNLYLHTIGWSYYKFLGKFFV